jgi:hypothetical protein
VRKKTLKNSVKMGGGYEPDKNLITFNSRKDLKDFVLSDKDNSEKIKTFYQQGFVPMKVINNIDLDTKDKLDRIIYDYNEKNSESFSKKDENELIPNDKFAQVVNYKGEIKINDTIYKYTSNGLYIVNEKDYESLHDFIKKNTSNKQKYKGLSKIDDKISLYVPDQEEFNDNYKILPPNDPCPPDENGYGGCGGGGGAPYYPNIPDYTWWYNYCFNTSSSWVNNIFGRSYACEYYFNGSYKLRTVFAVEDYYLFFDVYADAEFKQHTWFGWFACRDANTVYLKINNANLTFTDRTVNLNLTIGAQDIQNFWTQINQLFASSSQKRAAYISTLWDRYNGSNSKVDYSPSYDELLISANTVRNESRAYIATPIVDIPSYNVQFDFSNFFGPQTNRVVVVTVMGETQAITNMDILTLMVDAYKKYGNNRRDVGVVIVNKELNNETAKILSYATGNDLIVSHNLAFAGKDFDVPKSLKINDLIFLYSQNQNGSSTFGFKAGFTFKTVDKYDVDIESGAFYDNRWGGSRFRIIRD